MRASSSPTRGARACRQPRSGRTRGPSTAPPQPLHLRCFTPSLCPASLEGGWLEGKKHGRGTLKAADGKLIYEGDFEKDKEHGQGRLITPNGGVYEGQFEHGKKTGKAKYTDPSGLTYEGEFVDGQREGYGKYTNPDGTVAHEGMWKQNQPVTGVDAD